MENKGLRVLSVPWGISGVVTLKILSEIQQITKKKIVDLFDFFVGTGVGALIVASILKFPLEEVESLVNDVDKEIFAAQDQFLKRGSRRSTYKLEALLREKFGDSSLLNLLSVQDLEKKVCLHFPYSSCLLYSYYLWLVQRVKDLKFCSVALSIGLPILCGKQPSHLCLLEHILIHL
jgi:patatin-like phospholipase/acyl hydrolase